jgi:dTDP-4-amino-4,6-dideoxygalactose transaminase
VVPVVDLSRWGAEVADTFATLVAAVARRGVYLLGDETRGLEADLAGWATDGGERPSHAVAVASGATALQLTLRGLGVGPGDEVIVPAFTAVPTASAVAALGATPVLVDVEADTANLDPCLVDAARTTRTRAVVVVHLYGRPATLPDTDLPIVEDAAQAQGALSHDGRSAAVAYSFYPTKNLGGIGDGGAVVSTDRDLIDRVARLRTHGMAAQYVHEEVSQNFRLSEIEAAWLRLGLPHLAAWNERRRAIAARYREAAPQLRWQTPHQRHAYHLCVARFAERDTARAHLAELGVGTAVHYPLAVNQQPAYRCLSRAAYPQAEAWAAECVSLPCFAQMTDAEVDLVASALATLAPETAR